MVGVGGCTGLDDDVVVGSLPAVASGVDVFTALVDFVVGGCGGTGEVV